MLVVEFCSSATSSTEVAPVQASVVPRRGSLNVVEFHSSDEGTRAF